jgi:membrane dipeptidase
LFLNKYLLKIKGFRSLNYIRIKAMSDVTNPIEFARNYALEILQPSQRDLEHGLELHRQSLVTESYGLGLHAPVETEKLNDLMTAGASAYEFQDLHEEMMMLGWLRTNELRNEYREAWEISGVNCTFLNAGEESNDPAILMKRFARYVHITDVAPDLVRRVTNINQIRTAQKDGVPCLCLTLNGVPLSGKFKDTNDELRYIRVFAQLGAKMMHLTYNRANALGFGCGELNDGGLTDFGYQAVAEMNRLGIIIDLAHTGWKTCIDAAKASSQPVIVSHSGAHAISAHIRCKPDEVIKAVLDTGGTMGITNIPRFLGRTGDISAMLDHLDYVIKKFGDDSVTVGMDSPHKAQDAAAADKDIHVPFARQRWEALWPDGSCPFDDEWTQPHQLQSLKWTNWPMITVGLVQRGHSDDTIRKVLGENLMRVAGTVWKDSSAT